MAETTKIKLHSGDVPLLKVIEESDDRWRLVVYHEGTSEANVLVQAFLNPEERMLLARALIAPTRSQT